MKQGRSLKLHFFFSSLRRRYLDNRLSSVALVEAKSSAITRTLRVNRVGECIFIVTFCFYFFSLFSRSLFLCCVFCEEEEEEEEGNGAKEK